MIVLGIDPGTIVMGYGIVDSESDTLKTIEYGAFTPPKRSPIGERLSFLYGKLCAIIARYRPAAVAVEQPFVAKNVKSALAIGRAQAIAILASAQYNTPCFEYTPAQVKQLVANYGASSKEQVQEMVRLQLGLAAVPEPNDAADALAVALCHLQQVRLTELVNR